MGFNATGGGRRSRTADVTLFVVMLFGIGGLVAGAMGVF